MPIELILQLVAPLAESLVTGLLKGALTHAQTTGTIPAIPVYPPAAGVPVYPPVAGVPATGLTQADFATIAQMIEKALAAVNQPKAAA